jgi:hypothetical protein
MRLNLDTLRTEIQEYLDAHGMVVFQSFPRSSEPGPAVYWDTVHDPGFRPFLAAAEAAGVRLITLYARELEEAVIEEALEQLAGASFDRDERRAIEMRLKEMRGYAGFTCQIELAFDLAPRVYILDLRTEWFDDLNELVERIEDAYRDEDDGPGEEPLGGGYFSKN